MKNLLTDVFDLFLWLLLWGMAAYAILSFTAYTVTADEVLTPDERVVAITLLGEARGEGDAGMYAVACVIQKRAEERKLTLAQVCNEEWQFSCWNKGQEKYLDLMARLLKSNTVQAKYAKLLARAMCAGGKLTQDFTGNANHYHATYVTPSWVKGKTPTRIIGKHLFYKLP
jgi:spore germination cell wall hydrolase CwlJ-like protein